MGWTSAVLDEVIQIADSPVQHGGVEPPVPRHLQVQGNVEQCQGTGVSTKRGGGVGGRC